MKLLITIILFTFSLTSLAMSKESARNLYDMNKETFSEKEMMQDASLCKFQNELADILGEEKLYCSPRLGAKDDTSRGDALVRNTLREANRMESFQNQFDNYGLDNKVLDKAILKMKNKLN